MQSKKENVIITAIGQDRPGIVAGVTKVLFEAGCNLEDSSMTILEGDFAMILVVALPSGIKFDSLDQKFDEVRRNLGLDIFLKILPSGARPLTPCPAYMISVYGADQPGIVYRVAQLLSKSKVNITDVNTRKIDEGGSSVYMMMLEVELPKEMDSGLLKRDLELLGKDLSITMVLHPIETLTL